MNTSVVHMHNPGLNDQKNAKSCFLFSRIAIRGSKSACGIFKKSIFLIQLGAFRDQFLFIPPHMFFRKSCLGGKFGCKNLPTPLGVLFLERANLDKDMFWKPLVMHVYNTCIWVPLTTSFLKINQKYISVIYIFFTTQLLHCKIYDI